MGGFLRGVVDGGGFTCCGSNRGERLGSRRGPSFGLVVRSPFSISAVNIPLDNRAAMDARRANSSWEPTMSMGEQ